MDNIVPQDYNINRISRNKLKGHRPLVIWFSGLSGSGKSTLASLVEQVLFNKGIHTYSLDGDNIRSGLNKDLGFSQKHRSENIRRIAEVAKLFFDSGTVVIAAFISPLRADRETVKDIVGEENFFGVFVDTSIEECERRDVKGLYKKARAGEIKDFTGISSPYEKPLDFNVIIDTESCEIDKAVEIILKKVAPKLILKDA
ncbi:adenylyl-sulfate kinase [Zunongwangia sp. H14]|uniref:adenylyl-sulfate kinase n=1 Tax=Zunongwangia sp. H14 TaxID=3240792 RepID=UPI003567B6F6